MGGGKKKALAAATNTAVTGNQNAQNFNNTQQPILGAEASNAASNAGALGTQLGTAINTGSVNPNDAVNQQFNKAAQVGNDLATGGFNPSQSAAFVRSATRGAAAGYNADQDALNRRLSVQGGYMPGFTSSQSALDRARAQQSAEAATNANVALQKEETANKTAGAQILNQGATGMGNYNQGAIKNLMNYYQSNINQMNDAQKQQLAVQLMALGANQDQVNAFLGSASQQASGLQTAGAIIGDIGTLAGGAAAGAKAANP